MNQKIGLIDVDSYMQNKRLKDIFPNLVLMKLSAWHKSKGDKVEMFNIMKQNYDKIYASKVFTWSHLPFNLPEKTKKGGSGYIDWRTKLPDNIEHIYPDYDLYGYDYAMGYLTRGCNNNCPFCIVTRKEGKNHLHAKLEEFWNGQSHLKLLDNSLTENKEAITELIKIRDNGIRLDLTQGFNIRTITPEYAKVLSEIKKWSDGHWHTAWDNNGKKDKQLFMNGLKILNKCGIKNEELMVLCLVGFENNFKADLERINILKSLKIRPFVMIYRDPNIMTVDKVKQDRKYTLLAGWANFKPKFFTMSFKKWESLNNRDILKEEKLEKQAFKSVSKLGDY